MNLGRCKLVERVNLGTVEPGERVNLGMCEPGERASRGEFEVCPKTRAMVNVRLLLLY